uniref:L-lactate dehydrogenase n=1 Tax=Timema tahoe TaxID=61484 RepID=A0A7R9FP52_9NEOP|nr:unnamed protein product [Timema tahoe]
MATKAEEVYLHLSGGKVENHFVNTTLSTPNRDLNLDHPVIGNLVYCESSALDQTATEGDKMPSNMRKALMTTISPVKEQSTTKVTVVGSGQVGIGSGLLPSCQGNNCNSMAVAFSLLVKQICTELALVDVDEKRLVGETMDLQHGATFVKAKITCSTNYEVTRNSKLCIVTAGVRQQDGETRINLVQRNVGVFRQIIPQLAAYSPDSVLLIVSNPVDVLTYVAWKLSNFPQHRVIGSGTTLDSSRFRVFISERLNVHPSSVHGWIIGEHGDTSDTQTDGLAKTIFNGSEGHETSTSINVSVPVWSGVNVSGVRLRDLDPNIGSYEDPDCFGSIHKQVIERQIYLEDVYPHFREGKMENHLGKTTLNAPDWRSNTDLLINCESDALDHVATEAGKTILITLDRESNLDLPVIGSLAYCERDASDRNIRPAATGFVLCSPPVESRARECAYNLIKMKGYTSWAVALSVSAIAGAILKNTMEVMPVTTYIKGCRHGVDKEVFLSLPCVLGENGVQYIVKQPLNEEEKRSLHRSAETLHDLQVQIKI